ncbi:restriction endonuclease subunit S [Jeotgalibaca caeni]|uniref:restriction endonuclease subunit S n=1 Tax=Jeotgalibaca caeni TaxID=3028623 RepID=UPI00237E0921|nr:restriction endonuclease subunit S [Jeotgalibaca caeni]MDE1549496.1 restriction endonuclease subunit S [Jeotgalibaca caeni]
MVKKVPEIRFKGFFDDWVQRKLGEVGSFSKGRGYTKNDLTVKGKPIILYGQLYTNYQTVIDQIETFTIEKENSVISEGEEVIVPSSGESPKDISRASVIDYKGVILGGDLNIIKVNELIDPVFLALVISNGKTQRELSNKAQGKSIVHLHNSDLEQVHFSYTKIEEQIKIGIFIRNIEKNITLHQRKLEALQQLKKGFLQKMFPTDKQKVPQFRFSSFEESWEKRKLGDVSPLRGGYAFQSEQFCNQGVPIIRISNILSNGNVGGDYAFYNEQERDDKYILPDGAALLAMSGATTGKVAVLSNPSNTKIYQNQRVGYFSDLKIVNYQFVSTLVKSYLFINQLSSVLIAGAQPNVSSKEINSFEFYFPNNLTEQIKIGHLFNQLDDTIVLHQIKLEKLEHIKKSFLQKMFI